MLKKTIKYTDYDGNEREEDFYFNLSKAELMEMELSQKGGIINLIERVVKEKDQPKILEIFKDLILRSYGQKSPDGKRFVKSQEVRDSFEQTEAYSELFMEIALDEDKAAAFVKAVAPKVSDKEREEYERRVNAIKDGVKKRSQ